MTVETSETTGQADTQATATSLNDLFPSTDADNVKLIDETSGEDTTQETETETETAGQETQLDKTTETTETETAGNIFEINVEGKIEKFDISKDEEKTRLIGYAQKGRHYEKRMHEVKEVESGFQEREGQLNKIYNAVQFAYLKNLSKGDFILNEPDWEMDYKESINYETTEQARDKYKQDKAQYNETLRHLSLYQTQLNSSGVKWNEQKGKFLTAHPEITNFTKWVNENCDKYIEPITTFGAKALPDDFFEMIYFWNNKDQYVKQALEDDRKKRATAQQTVKTRQTVKTEPARTYEDPFLKILVQEDKRKLIN